MIHLDDVPKENIKEHNPNSPQIPDHPYIIFFKKKDHCLIDHLSDIDKIYLYANDLDEAKYQLLINKQESTGLK